MGKFALRNPVTGKIIKYFNVRSELTEEELEQVRIQDREYYKIRKDIIAPRQLIKYHENREYNLKNQGIWREKNPYYNKASKYKKKIIVIDHYSNGKMNCICCGEKTFEFLSINHINGRKAEGHKSGFGGTTLYQWLITNNFPEGYNVLCFNCNLALGFFGYCPHKNNSKEQTIIKGEMI